MFKNKYLCILPVVLSTGLWFPVSGSAQPSKLPGSGQAASTGSGQAFPTRPIRWLVPVPAGSTTDIVTRIVAQKMSDAFGQQVVVDNRPGGVMTIATDLVAKAPPDGYTLATLLTPTAVNPYVLKTCRTTPSATCRR